VVLSSRAASITTWLSPAQRRRHEQRQSQPEGCAAAGVWHPNRLSKAATL